MSTSLERRVIMFKHVLSATLALFLSTGTIYAQHGHSGGHSGGGGGGHGSWSGGGGYRGGYGGYGGYGRGYGGYGGYGRGYYGGYGGWGYPFYGFGYGLGGYGLGGYGGGYYGGSSYPYYDYSDGSYYGTYGAPDTTTVLPYSSGYTPALTDPHAPTTIEIGNGTPTNANRINSPASATVTVIAPQGGQVWFNDTLSPPKTGSKYVFTSDKLDAGKTHVVNIKARWQDASGKDWSHSIPLKVEAGDNLTVDLTKIQ
jgi:uncharacterized protein (TIGR03000 family)